MAAQNLYIDDICAHNPTNKAATTAPDSIDDESICIIDRTVAEVSSHFPSPQRNYTNPITKERSISVRDLELFLKTGRPPTGTALVIFLQKNEPKLVKCSSLRLLRRMCHVGQIVKKGPKDAMTGTVIEKDEYYDLTLFNFDSRATNVKRNILSNRRVEKVPAGETKPVDEFLRDDTIVFRNWLGTVLSTKEEVTLRLNNGYVFVPSEQTWLTMCQIDGRPGSLVVGDLIKVEWWALEKARYIVGEFEMGLANSIAQIIDIKVIQLEVEWIAGRYLQDGATADTSIVVGRPPVNISAEEPDFHEVHVINSGDRNSSARFELYHTVRFVDINAAVTKYGPKFQPTPKTPHGFDLNVFCVRSVQTFLTIQWQDSSITSSVACTEIHPHIDYEDAHEFFPGQIVLPKISYDGFGANFVAKKLGVIQSVDTLERLARVLWQPNANCEYIVEIEARKMHLQGSSETGLPVKPQPEGQGYFEDVPVFDLSLAPGVDRRLGDIVLLIGNRVGNRHNSENDAETPFETHVAIPLSITSWYGRVKLLELDGSLRIACEGDTIEEIKVAPELTMVGITDDDYDSASEDDDEDDDDEMDYDGSDADNSDTGSRSPIDTWIENEDGTRIAEDPEDNDDEWSTEGDDDVEMVDIADLSEEQPRSETEPIVASTPLNQPPQYEILEDSPPTDHHFLVSSSTSSTTPANIKRIRKEHKVLTGSLPDGVYVRSWESRLDLFRVLYTGPLDTPYEMAPLLFDFIFPDDFPHSPPKAFFHSWTFGHGSVNPNLYEDGKVCLSLLNTWHGEAKMETWHPAKSTFLQVIVSILGLVLVREPYFNEAGYEVHIGNEQSKLPSAQYSEKVYFQTRGFIKHALQLKLEPFGSVLEWLYINKDPGSPHLLDKAVKSLKEVIADEGKGNIKAAGLNYPISRGAMIMFKRHLDALEQIETTAEKSD